MAPLGFRGERSRVAFRSGGRKFLFLIGEFATRPLVPEGASARLGGEQAGLFVPVPLGGGRSPSAPPRPRFPYNVLPDGGPTPARRGPEGEE